MHHFTSVALAILAGTASAVLQDWQQCGGINYSGDTQCATGSGCVKINDYYSQCQPGAAPAPTTTAIPTTTVPDPTTLATTTAPISTSVPAGSGPGTTLQTGYYWIRAVASPNFHKYMQTSPLYSPGPALLGSYTTAGQFQVVSGQLVQLVSAPGEKPEKFLYATVSETRSINNMSLAVTFTEAKNTYGTFKFGGDDLQWSVSSITRPNPSAWYVCAGQKMYINLGNYMYQTPSGCADQTIHYYNDKTANS
ncbi:carbohydrate-binding module family 1 protein [Lentithecium fluviatile CBS 122367]|uniref:Carbohydrate-binding module family 1 protein n=1 Tax=Lentithecium fluviatile CBS 122367 TaxID=1168545 RepID=A0A6G1JF75_9PLEO|nr:carbohydrate-binding module family 1 protein [Lentithecium fluviatile CBS 122367]